MRSLRPPAASDATHESTPDHPYPQEKCLFRFQGPFPLDKTGERHALEKHPHVLIQLPPEPSCGADAFPFAAFCPVQAFHRRDVPFQTLEDLAIRMASGDFASAYPPLAPACGNAKMPAGRKTRTICSRLLDGNAFLAGDFRQLDTGPRRPSRQIDQKTEPVSGASRITHAFPLKDHTLRIGSDLSKSLIEILKNVVDVFDTDGQPDQFRRQSRVTLLFFAELRVTCARWMERKALGIAHVGEMTKRGRVFRMNRWPAGWPP